CISGNKNSRIMPLVFSLMTKKSMESYRRLFQGLIDFAKEHDVDLSPQIVLTDFEVAVINAVQSKFDNVWNKRIQTSGLATRYGTDKDFSILMRHIPALAFLPHSEIPVAFDELKDHIPWFEDNYVHSRVRHVHRNSILIWSEPSFPPDFWSVSENIEFAYPRTQNVIEDWHRRWEILVSCAHLGVFKIIKELRKEQNKVEVSIEAILQ
ncbi:40219_t:CDS:2, partial [Gigaspora margarita]